MDDMQSQQRKDQGLKKGADYEREKEDRESKSMLQMLMVTLQKQQEQIDMFMNQASTELNQMR